MSTICKLQMYTLVISSYWYIMHIVLLLLGVKASIFYTFSGYASLHVHIGYLFLLLYHTHYVVTTWSKTRHIIYISSFMLVVTTQGL